MSTTIESEIYNLDRKAASKLLKISVRTLDRYIKSKKVSTRVVDGRVWLDKGGLKDYMDEKSGAASVDSENMSTPDMSIDVDVGNDHSSSQDYVQSMSTVRKISKEKSPSGVYKKLFSELKEDLNEKQARLEIANYRVGQLEAQLKNSIPMLEFHRENYEKKQKEQGLENKISEQTTVLMRIKTQLKYEKFNKRIFLTILMVILTLQPLWLLLIYR